MLVFPLYPRTPRLHLRGSDGGVEISRGFEDAASRSVHLLLSMRHDAADQKAA